MNPSTAEELVEANVPPFRDLLEAHPDAGIKPKRILLRNVGKNYDFHIGRVRTPLVESIRSPSSWARTSTSTRSISSRPLQSASGDGLEHCYTRSCNWRHSVRFDEYIFSFGVYAAV